MRWPERPGALLMTYGSPASLAPEDVRAYLASIRGGREPEAELVDEFVRRYAVIGGSPLITITRQQATALADVLGWPVEVGMRFSEPSILAGLQALSDAGATSVAAIILSPQYSPLLMHGYARAIEAAKATMRGGAPEVVVAGAWFTEPSFIAALGRRVVDALDQIPPPDRQSVRILMTAHSLPKRVAVREPDYLAQLLATADRVAARAGLGDGSWTFCWQSAGHEPGEWMKPDFADLMPEVAASGGGHVIVVPVQFLADHLEVLYDIDVAAREQAARSGLTLRRIASLNADPDLIEALAKVAEHTMRESLARV